MPLTKSNQTLHSDLNASAAALDWAALELIDIADRVIEAGLTSVATALIEVSRVVKMEAESMYAHADDVHDGLLTRLAECP